MAGISTYLWPGQVHIGAGAAKLVGDQVQALGISHAFLMTDPGILAFGLLDTLMQSLADAGVHVTRYDDVIPNPDIESVHRAAKAYHLCGSESIVGVGGGSALDTAKAMRLLLGGPNDAGISEYSTRLGAEARPTPQVCDMPALIAIPTTAGTGSEVTPWAVITDKSEKAKFGVGTGNLLPTIALIDPELTLSLPPDLTAATGIDALSHLIEAYVSTNHQPALDPLILRGIELIGRYLRKAVHQSGNLHARTAMVEAAMLGGIAISSNWLGACHALAHQLSSFADLHHGVAIALLLPGQMAYNLSETPERYADIGQALEPQLGPDETLTKRAEHAVKAVRRLIGDIGLPARLRDAGVDQSLIPAMASSAYLKDFNWKTNPRAIDRAAMEQLYHEAY